MQQFGVHAIRAGGVAVKLDAAHALTRAGDRVLHQEVLAM